MPDSVGKQQRSTGDLLILMVAGTICFSVLASGAAIAMLNIFRPETDTSSAVASLNDIINTLIGVLAGFLAGKTHQAQEIRREPPVAADT